MRCAISPEEKLLVTLEYFATGETSVSLSHSYRLGRSSVLKVIHKTCLAMIEVLGPIFLKVGAIFDIKNNIINKLRLQTKHYKVTEECHCQISTT